MPRNNAPDAILSVDIGGSNIKAALLDANGNLVHPYSKAATPRPSSPDAVLEALYGLVATFPAYACVSVGFPGYVKEGVIITAPNLDTEQWAGFPLEEELEQQLGCPARVLNDADMQALGIAEGKGLELVVTLGTGFGTALLYHGALLPHLELAHHPVTKTKDYDQYIGDKALDAIGPEKWRKRMNRVLNILQTVFNYDTLYIGGGNARLLGLPESEHIRIVRNRDGIRGGARLWAAKDLKANPRSAGIIKNKGAG